MGKYTLLSEYLRNLQDDTVTLAFGEIEAIVGQLPDSAHKYRPWWANDRTQSGRQSDAWLSVGWRVEHVNLGNDVTFRRIASIGNGSYSRVSYAKGSECSLPSNSWQEFEEKARVAISQELGAELDKRPLLINGKKKHFDLVNEQLRVVGDIKHYKITEGGNRPSAKFSTLNEYVWLFGLVDKFTGQRWRKILVLGEDLEVAKSYVREFDSWLGDLEVYYFSRETCLRRVK